jgi:hypothetical protein
MYEHLMLLRGHQKQFYKIYSIQHSKKDTTEMTEIKRNERKTHIKKRESKPEWQQDSNELQDQYHLSPAHKNSLISELPQRLLKIFAKFSLNYLPSICHVAVAFSKARINGKSLLIFCNAHVIITNLQKSDTKFVTIFRVKKLRLHDSESIR